MFNFFNSLNNRFTDFFVNEIDENNNVIVLTDIGLPVDLIADEKKKARDEANALKVNVCINIFLSYMCFLIVILMTGMAKRCR